MVDWKAVCLGATKAAHLAALKVEYLEYWTVVTTVAYSEPRKAGSSVVQMAAR